MNHMRSVMDTVMCLRGGNPFCYSDDNNNMYRIVSKEADGSSTAYYFSTPIYRRMDCKPVELRFALVNGNPVFHGSDARISYDGESLFLQSGIGSLLVSFDGARALECVSGMLRNESVQIRPTLNGIAVAAACSREETFSFTLSTTDVYKKIRNTEAYIAFMHGRFEPFFVISGLYAHSLGGGLQPVKLSLERIDENTYHVSVRTSAKASSTVVFEINMYEGKFFQDTPVSSRLPDKNNCFGSVAFLGQTQQFGEQWLYTKTSRKKVFDIEQSTICSVKMHIPVFEADVQSLAVYLPQERFCSFGSTWAKKVPCGDLLGMAQKKDDYFTVDMTALLTNPETGRLRKAEGIVLRLPQGGHAVLATGDCCMMPQILEVNYRA